MKRKVLSLLLCALLIAGLTFGCANKKAPPLKDTFFEIADSVSKLEEIGFDASLSMSIPTDSESNYTSFMGDITDAKLSISGSSSKFFNQFACEILATVRGSQGESTLKVTDILFDDSGLYINLRTLFNLLSLSQGIGGPYDALFNSDYLGITPEDLSAFTGMPLSNLQDKENLPKNQELNNHMLKVFRDSLKAENFKEEGGIYTLTLNSSDLAEIAKAFASDVETNAGIYADALLETAAVSPGYLAILGLEKENPSRDEVIAFVKEKAAELSSDLAQDTSIGTSSLLISLGKGKADKSYDIRVSLTAPEEDIDIKADISLAEVGTEKITPPTDYVKFDDFLSIFLM